MSRLDAALQRLARAVGRMPDGRASANAAYFGTLAGMLDAQAAAMEELRLAVLEMAHLSEHLHPLPPAFVWAAGEARRASAGMAPRGV